MDATPLERAREEEKNNGTKSSERVVGKIETSNIAKTKHSSEKNDKRIGAYKVGGNRDCMPDDIKKVRILSYPRQLLYYATENRYTRAIILPFLVLWIGVLILICIISLSFRWELFVPLALVWLGLSLLALYMIFIKRQKTGPVSVAIPTVLNNPIPNIVGAEGDQVVFGKEDNKVVSFQEVKMQPIPINKKIEDIPTASGALVTAEYACTIFPVPEAALVYRDYGKLVNIEDSVDDIIQQAITQEFAKHKLEIVQALPDRLIIDITINILDKLAPNTWQIHNCQSKESMSLINPDNPIYLYRMGVKISLFRVKKVRPSDGVIAAQNKTEEERFERVSDLDNYDTLILATMRTVRSLRAMNSNPNPFHIFISMLERENIKMGAKTLPGVQAAATAFAESLLPEINDEIDMKKVLTDFIKTSGEEREQLIKSIHKKGDAKE